MNSRTGSITAMCSADQPKEGGSIPTPVLTRAAWRVVPVSLDTTRNMVEREHYSRGGSNTRVYTLGIMPVGALFESECVAVSWWLPPTKACGASVWPKNPHAVLALSRLVCEPHAPKNSPSFMLAHAKRWIDTDAWPVWITFADEWQGHTGAIYLAAGWMECGRTKPEPTFVNNGRMVCRKAGPKTRTRQQMIELGCEYVGSFSRRRFVWVRPDLRDEFEPIRQRLASLPHPGPAGKDK